jgi:hypothetical protein
MTRVSKRAPVDHQSLIRRIERIRQFHARTWTGNNCACDRNQQSSRSTGFTGLSFGPSQGDASQQILELSRLIGGRFMDDTA